MHTNNDVEIAANYLHKINGIAREYPNFGGIVLMDLIVKAETSTCDKCIIKITCCDPCDKFLLNFDRECAKEAKKICDALNTTT